MKIKTEKLYNNLPKIKAFLRQFNVMFTAIIILLFSSIATRGTFFSLSNLINVGERASIIGLVAIGQTLVILSGGIDLSVGAIMSVSYTTLVVYNSFGLPFGSAVILSLISGGLFGLLNGLLVKKTRIPSFLVTLATMMIGFSLSNTILGTLQLRYTDFQSFINNFFGLNQTMARLLPTIVWLIFSMVFIFILSKSSFGLSVFSVGGGAKAAFLSGINIKNVQISVFIVSGVISAVAGLIFAYRIGFLMPTSSDSFLIESIAAVVLGGTNINGGEGSIYGSFFGAIVIAVLLNVLSILRIDPYVQYVIMGFLLMAIVLNISYLSSRK